MLITFIADRLFDGEQFHSNCPITIEDGKIIALDRVAGAKEVRLTGILAPGFIDTQVNGGGGALFNHQPDVNALLALSTAHARFGTTSVLPTLITTDINKMSMAADTISEALTLDIPGIIGVHFEGPHLSAIKKGIHNDDHIRTLSQQELDIFCRDDLGLKIVTLAPENVSCDTIKTLVENNVIVSLGHSNATYHQTVAALAAGATGFTHLFNAMSGLTSREPNMVGAALLDEQSWCGLILDGHHVHPASARLATQAKATGKTMLVTDSMSTIGSDQTALTFDSHNIELVGDKLTSQTGQLAGSALDMITAVNNARSMLDVSFAESLRMASVYPANFLGINTDLPILRVGAKADFTLLEESTHSPDFQVRQTWIGGKQIF